MSVHRVKSGLIFDDGFDTLDSRWVVSPSNSYAYDEEGHNLTLLHNDTDRSTNALFPIPQEEGDLLLQVVADYTPVKLGDEGGIVIWKNALEKVEFLESEDTTEEDEYSVWRAVKRANLWTFFANRGGAWELFDSTICINPSMAGVVLKSKDRDGYVPMGLERVILCRGSHISVGNMSDNYKVELLNEGGEIVNTQVVSEGFTGVSFELPTIPFTGKLKIYDTDGRGGHILLDTQEELAVMYGGDVFLRGTDLKVIWNGEELSEVTPTKLGTLKYSTMEQKMTVKNPTTGNVAENINIKIAAYEEEFGWTWCDLATDIDGKPGPYQDIAIDMGTLGAGETRDFWVKITAQEMDFSQSPKKEMRATHFYLEVRND